MDVGDAANRGQAQKSWS